MSTESNRMLLKHHLEKLRLPTIRREWESAAATYTPGQITVEASVLAEFDVEAE